jgi:hypothetical protein
VEPVPALPTLEEVGREAFTGNVWVVELLDADPLRFAVEDGRLVFADATRRFDGDVPPRYRASVRAVREGFDLGAFFEAAEDPGAYTFVCDATVHRHLPYDWDRLPAVVGVEVHDAAADRWLSPDAAVRVYERLGLATPHAFERELAARHFYPDRYETPASGWYDGPPAGILVRDKNGTRAVRYHPTFDPEAPVSTDRRALETLVAEYVTDERIARVAATLEADDPGFDALFDRVVDAVFRETPAVVEGADRRAFRSATAERVRRWLD